MKRYDPLAPTRPRALRRLARRDVNAQFLPLLAQLNREFGARSQAGQSSILAGTNELAAQLAPLAGQTHDIYAQAQGSQGAVDTALANRLSAAGVSLGGEIGGKLAAAGIPAQLNTAPAIGAGASAAGFGIGSAALSRLIGEGAAAEGYAGALPGIARLGGAQRSRQFGQQLESERAQAAGDLRAKIPGTLAQVLADLRNLEFQKAATRIGFQGDVLSAQARAASTAETARGHNLTYKSKMAAIDAANARTGMTLVERARHNQRTEAEQVAHDQEAIRQHRQAEKQRRRQQ